MQGCIFTASFISSFYKNSWKRSKLAITVEFADNGLGQNCGDHSKLWGMNIQRNCSLPGAIFIEVTGLQKPPTVPCKNAWKATITSKILGYHLCATDFATKTGQIDQRSQILSDRPEFVYESTSKQFGVVRSHQPNLTYNTKRSHSKWKQFPVAR